MPVSKPFGSALVVLYPIIVFDGPMFTMAVGEDGKLGVGGTQHVVHQTQFAQQTYWVDVVAKDDFARFLSTIDREGEWFTDPQLVPQHETAGNPER